MAVMSGDRRTPDREDDQRARHERRAPAGRRTENSLVYQHTDPKDSADLFLVAATGTRPPVRLSDSCRRRSIAPRSCEPQLVHYPGARRPAGSGLAVRAAALDRSKKHPAIVWIHGDGINQNYDGWHVQRNYAVYYSFHQYLLQQGYVVLAPDYRGSIGYGRDWRQGRLHGCRRQGCERRGWRRIT